MEAIKRAMFLFKFRCTMHSLENTVWEIQCFSQTIPMAMTTDRGILDLLAFPAY